MRISFFRERLLEGVGLIFTPLPDFSGSTSTPVKAETETTPKKFKAQELVSGLGISEAQAKLLISGAKGDATAEITEQELFEQIKKGKVIDIGVRQGLKGVEADKFEAANYNNYGLLQKLDKLDGKTNIKFNKESKDIAWEAAGAEEPVSVETPLAKGESKFKLADGIKPPDINYDPSIVANDSRKIQELIKSQGGDPSQKIELQGTLLTGLGDMGSSNVRLYTVGEGDSKHYVAIKQSDASILSKDELGEHLDYINQERGELQKAKLDSGFVDDILSGKFKYIKTDS